MFRKHAHNLDMSYLSNKKNSITPNVNTIKKLFLNKMDKLKFD